MTTDSKGNGQNNLVCSSQSETTRIIASLRPCKSLHVLPHLPFDLVVEILCRLPVKHLLQFCCVSKAWNSLISHDSNFSKKHLRLSTSNHERHHHLIWTPTNFPKVLYHSPISAIFSSASTTTSVKQFTYSITETLLGGGGVYSHYGASTCDGIVCFKTHNSLAVLCNPSIRKFKRLPPLKVSYQSYTSYTLVYDRFTNNYKIIALYTMTSKKIEVYVHALGTHYWRRIQDFPAPDLVPRRSSGAFVNDSVNWLTYDSDCRAPYIVSLDLEKESYQKFSLPNDIISYIKLGTLRDCLSLLFRRRDGFSNVWIMKEYGNEKSWIKILSVPPMVECNFYCYTRALYISKDDKVLMEFVKWGKYSLVIYDSINHTCNIPDFENNICGEMVTQEVYVESLISPL